MSNKSYNTSGMIHYFFESGSSLSCLCKSLCHFDWCDLIKSVVLFSISSSLRVDVRKYLCCFLTANFRPKAICPYDNSSIFWRYRFLYNFRFVGNANSFRLLISKRSCYRQSWLILIFSIYFQLSRFVSNLWSNICSPCSHSLNFFFICSIMVLSELLSINLAIFRFFKENSSRVADINTCECGLRKDTNQGSAPTLLRIKRLCRYYVLMSHQIGFS